MKATKTKFDYTAGEQKNEKMFIFLFCYKLNEPLGGSIQSVSLLNPLNL